MISSSCFGIDDEDATMRSQIWQSMSESLLELMTDDNNKLFSEEIAVPHGMKYVVMKKGNIQHHFS